MLRSSVNLSSDDVTISCTVQRSEYALNPEFDKIQEMTCTMRYWQPTASSSPAIVPPCLKKNGLHDTTMTQLLNGTGTAAAAADMHNSSSSSSSNNSKDSIHNGPEIIFDPVISNNCNLDGSRHGGGGRERVKSLTSFTSLVSLDDSVHSTASATTNGSLRGKRRPRSRSRSRSFNANSKVWNVQQNQNNQNIDRSLNGRRGSSKECIDAYGLHINQGGEDNKNNNNTILHKPPPLPPKSYTIPLSDIVLVDKHHHSKNHHHERLDITTWSNGYYQIHFTTRNSYDVLLAFLKVNLPADRISSVKRGSVAYHLKNNTLKTAANANKDNNNNNTKKNDVIDIKASRSPKNSKTKNNDANNKSLTTTGTTTNGGLTVQTKPLATAVAEVNNANDVDHGDLQINQSYSSCCSTVNSAKMAMKNIFSDDAGEIDVDKLTSKKMKDHVKHESKFEKIKRKVNRITNAIGEMSQTIAECACYGCTPQSSPTGNQSNSPEKQPWPGGTAGSVAHATPKAKAAIDNNINNNDNDDVQKELFVNFHNNTTTDQQQQQQQSNSSIICDNNNPSSQRKPTTTPRTVSGDYMKDFEFSQSHLNFDLNNNEEDSSTSKSGDSNSVTPVSEPPPFDSNIIDHHGNLPIISSNDSAASNDEKESLLLLPVPLSKEPNIGVTTTPKAVATAVVEEESSSSDNNKGNQDDGVEDGRCELNLFTDQIIKQQKEIQLPFQDEENATKVDETTVCYYDNNCNAFTADI